ncbi:MAG: DUF2007 domain-containing protein [Proteobacteria bacterium]|nr:DUF2007 domain-containing protein [Pseudomonadota bacterium]
MALVPVLSPETNSELVVAVALLEAHDVFCFVHNAGFGGLYPGVQLHIHNARRIYVPEEQVEAALELLRDFDREIDAPLYSPMSGRDKFRMVVELLLFGWFMPDSRARRSSARGAGRD